LDQNEKAMNLLRHIAILTTSMLCVAADTEAEQVASRAEAARTAGIEEKLVVDPTKRPELVEALRRRIMQGYVDEQAFRIALKKLNPPKGEFYERSKPYLDTRAKGLDRALFLASELRCVELVPLLVERADMRVLDLDTLYQKGEDARAVKAIVAMGLTAAKPLFDIVERSPHARERYYALSALQLGQSAWKNELEGKGLAERLEEQCDTRKVTVQLASALLRGKIHDARTAAGDDLENNP
jgi:hypothetical protein